MKSVENTITRARIAAFRSGIKAAASFANDYNELSMHPYRLGDCVLAEFGVRNKHPRGNKPTKETFARARRLLRELEVTDEAIVQLARVIMPDAWARYADKNGKVDEIEAWQCTVSLNIANDVLAAGYRDCARSREPIAESMRKPARRKALGSDQPKRNAGARKPTKQVR